jgi:uncharacterized membrane protein YdbT with pleckstrin-like domain
MSGQWLPEEGVRSLEKYMVPGGESMVFVVRKHWITLVEPIVTTVGSGIVMVFLAWTLGQKFADAANIVFLLWLVVLARGIFLVIEWRDSWFGATQRRLMLIHGLITRKVAMMPLEKVTDMSYARSPMGQLLGYGEFVLESAGQEQALRSVPFIPNPDQLYRALVTTMFGRQVAAKQQPATEPGSAESVRLATSSPPADSSPSSGPTEFPWQDRINEFLSDPEQTVRLPDLSDD